MKEVNLRSTEKYEIIFQHPDLVQCEYNRFFENACYKILQDIYAENSNENDISLSLELCAITDLSGRTHKYAVNRPAYKIEALRNPDVISSSKFMDLMIEFVHRLQKRFEYSYDEITMVIYTEHGPFYKSFKNDKRDNH